MSHNDTQGDRPSAEAPDDNMDWVDAVSKNGKPYRFGYRKTDSSDSTGTSKTGTGVYYDGPINGPTTYRLDPNWVPGDSPVEHDAPAYLAPITKYKLWKRTEWWKYYNYTLEVYCTKKVSLKFYDQEPDYYSVISKADGWAQVDYDSTAPNLVEVTISED
ncbi:hypothetical protein B0H16DRAFT_1885235 [Mycena metata]|uniref:Uncharacterized protein n=1 Tax=Mycena metata TaxID=1033252 RepID=A0AAD7NFL1_9AGAR|nr:hypothetical protein B0H16DRAFT_1885235 [Mycena metata]